MPVYLTCLVIAVPVVIIAAIMLALYVKETKGANLDEIGAEV